MNASNKPQLIALIKNATIIIPENEAAKWAKEVFSKVNSPAAARPMNVNMIYSCCSLIRWFFSFPHVSSRLLNKVNILRL